ncbi:MAG: MFS transporter [Inquilinus sp.]|nr:MFS transporter [Inquilinus sp.]
MSEPRPTPTHLTVLLAYGAPALPLAALSLPAYILLPSFYAAEIGLGFASVGFVLLVARIWDVVTDPLVGQLSDRLDTRFGRRRPWLVAGAPLVMTAVWFLFVPGHGAGAAHLLGWSLVLYTGWTMMILPLTAWGAELSTDYNERSRIAAFRETAIICGTLLALGLPLLIGNGDGPSDGQALEPIAWAVIALLPPSVIALLVLVPEPARRSRRRITIRKGIAVIAANAPFRRLIAAYLINGIANGLPATLFVLFVANVLEEPGNTAILLFVYFLSGILAVPFWLRLSYRFGKHRTWCYAMIWTSLIFIWVPFLGAGDLWWFAAVCVLTGVSLGADLVLPSSMQADVVDLDTAESGDQRTGLYFALWGMVTKFALALAVGLAFPLLELVGFEDGASNDPASLFAVSGLYSLAPVIFKAFAIVLVWRFPLDAERLSEVRRRIDAVDGSQ